jgi:hypothetical protein
VKTVVQSIPWGFLAFVVVCAGIGMLAAHFGF